MAQKQKELGGARQMSTGTKIVVGIFAVIMALSMMLPSLTAIFASDSSSNSEEPNTEQTDDASADDESAESEETDDSAEDASDETDANDDEGDEATSEDGKKSAAEAEVPDNETLKSLADQYADKIAAYDERLEDDPQNLAALLNKAQAYMNWGYNAVNSTANDEEEAYANNLVEAAIDAFDAYLVVRESVAVQVDKALCQYYLGNTDQAIKELEAVTKKYDDNPLAWANLGMLYETQYNTEKASEAYRKAAACDPDDEYGAYSYANQRLISINSTVSSPSDAGDASVDDVSTKTSTGLTSTLANDSGVGF